MVFPDLLLFRLVGYGTGRTCFISRWTLGGTEEVFPHSFHLQKPVNLSVFLPNGLKNGLEMMTGLIFSEVPS